MATPNDYIILRSNAAGLAEQVREKMKEGWTLYGTPYVTGADTHNQAMIKEGPLHPPVRGTARGISG